ncbi:MAG: hypothetical protein RMA76_40930 [Deltaproteobacteria bacterium]|jgi:hypothetical protein
MVPRNFGIWVFLATLAGCTGEVPPLDVGCASSPEATVELGQGATGYAPPDGTLRLARGPQGGCHLDLAVRTTGLPGTRATVDFTIFDVQAGERVLTSRLVTRLAGAGEVCEAFGIRALLARPWEIEDRRVTVTATVTDELLRTFEDGFDATVLWPEPIEGIEEALLCGDRD